MSDTVFERENDGRRISVGRFWRDNTDWIQFSTNGEYAQISYIDFEIMVSAVRKNVRETRDAWWHTINKEAKSEVK